MKRGGMKRAIRGGMNRSPEWRRRRYRPDPPATSKFTKWLRRFLEESELTHAELAEMVGCRPGLVTSHVLGEYKKPSPSTMEKFEKALGIDFKEVLKEY